jgi:hypothetical protein
MVRVVATPSQELALTNCAYCSRSDLGSYGSMVDVNNTIVLNLRYPYFLHFTSLSPPSSRRKILGNGFQGLRDVRKKIHGNELKGLMLERKSLEINFRV